MRHSPIPPAVSPQLDSLRGLSAVTVLVTHGYGLVVLPTSATLYTYSGLLSQAAVMLFFVLSGFLICKSITGNAARYGQFKPMVYAVDRLNRIVPPLLLALLIVLFLWFVAPMVFPTGTRAFAIRGPFTAGTEFDVSASALIGSLLFVNGFATGQLGVNAPLWSLAYEVWYYVAAGLIAALPGRRGECAAILLLLALGSVNHRFLLLSLVWFAGAGVALAHNAGYRGTKITRTVAALALFSAIAWGFLYVRSGVEMTSPQQLFGRAILLYAASIGLFFAAMLHEIVGGNLKLRPLATRSANYSYTLYIVHYPMLLMVWGVMQTMIYSNLTASIAVAVVGVLCCWYVARLLSKIEEWRPIRQRHESMFTSSSPAR